MPRRQQFEARFLTPDELELLADTIHADSRAVVLPSEIARRAGRPSVSFTTTDTATCPKVDHEAAAKLGVIRTVGLWVLKQSDAADCWAAVDEAARRCIVVL